MGHVDFYPAGGARQPGCLDIGPLSIGPGLTSLWPEFTCSHIRAVQFFKESIHAWPGSGSYHSIVYRVSSNSLPHFAVFYFFCCESSMSN